MSNSLKNHFLIAIPGLQDGFFGGAVTYICEHDEQGALGIVINQPLNMNLSEIHESFDEVPTQLDLPVYGGGPVQTNRGFILHSSEKRWDSTYPITEDIFMTNSRDILDDIARGEGPEKLLVAIGYAGWDDGQLEQEIADNAWLTCPADSDIIFNTPVEQRATMAAAGLGIDLSLLSTQAGHA